MVFGAIGAAKTDCVEDVPNGTTINSLTILPTYTPHTLTINTPLTTSGMTINGGNIAQPNGTTSSITCYGPLSWTSGTIGSQNNGASTLSVSNELSEIEGNGTKTLGDNFTLLGMLYLTGDGGNTLTLTNNATITNYGTIALFSGAYGISNATGSNGGITNYGTLETAGGAGTLESVPIVNDVGGAVNIGDSSGTAAKLEILYANPQNTVSFLNGGGTVTLYAGATLAPKAGYTQASGTFTVGGTSGTAQVTGLQNTSQMLINGGYVTFATAQDNLDSEWNFTMTGGKITLTVDATAGKNNFVQSDNGSISINNGSNMEVDTINIPKTGMPKQLWAIFIASNNLHGIASVGVKVVGAINYVGYNYGDPVGNNTQKVSLQS